MKTKLIHGLPLILIIVLILVAPKSINAHEVEDEREFDYAANSPKGPKKWGEIKKEWAACKNGTMQSPINLADKSVKLLASSSNSDKRTYKAENACLKNRGHDIQMKWLGDAGSMVINGTKYELEYAHWHSPSEHSINGRKYEMELHMVHSSKDDKIAVLGVMYRIGEDEPFLSKLMANISSMADLKGQEKSLGKIDPNDIDIRSKRYYRYVGSLTVPPCTEGVIWTVNKRVKTVSKEQVKLLREAVHDYAAANARPLQPHNSRDVYLYGPGSE